MNPFPYSDEAISENELMFALPSTIMGVSILSLPRKLALDTLYSDGWISLLLAGVFFAILAVIGTKVASKFPNQSYFSYASTLMTKPIAIGVVIIQIILFIGLSAFSIRSLAYISQQYLFEHTPMEVISLSFLLVVVYAVSGSRAGLFRLNVMFLPIILFVMIIIAVFNITWIDLKNFLPLFKTDMKGYIKGFQTSFEVYIGYSIVLFYVGLVNKPKKLTKKVIVGMSIPIISYIFIFLVTIGVYGNMVTANIELPSLELAKRVDIPGDIPGGIFERIDAIIFTIWTMAIFNTASMLLDVAVLLITSVFKQIKKRILTFVLAPIIYYLVMLPQEIHQVQTASILLSQFMVYFTMVLIVSLFVIASIRGVGKNEKKS